MSQGEPHRDDSPLRTALDRWARAYRERCQETYPSQQTRRCLERAEAELAVVLDVGRA